LEFEWYSYESLEPNILCIFNSVQGLCLSNHIPEKKYSYYIMDPISQSEPVVEPVVEPVPEPVSEPVVEPAVEVVPEPVSEPLVEPAVEVVPEPVSEPVAEPVVEPVVESVLSSVLEKVEESEVPPQDKVTHLYIPTVTTLPKPVRPAKKGMRFL
jgi:hypothetical protein